MEALSSRLRQLDQFFAGAFNEFSMKESDARLFTVEEWINGTVNSILRIMRMRRPDLVWDIQRVNYGEGWHIIGVRRLTWGQEVVFLKAEEE